MIEKTVSRLLRRRRLTLAVAESCTGGLIADSLTNITGSSSFFLLGVCAYANASKIKVCGVSPKTIKANGAVSQEVAIELARDIRHLALASVGISTTGIAGPTGGSRSKPVGTVFVAVSLRHQDYFKKFKFSGSRRQIKQKAKNATLNFLRVCLLG